MKCKNCKRNKAVEEGFCEHCIVYEKDPDKDNPLPHVFHYKGEEHIIFNKNELEDKKYYPLFYEEKNHLLRKSGNVLEIYVKKEED